MVFKIVNLFDFLALEGPEHLKLLLLLLKEVVEGRGRNRGLRRRVGRGLSLIVGVHRPGTAAVDPNGRRMRRFGECEEIFEVMKMEGRKKKKKRNTKNSEKS